MKLDYKGQELDFSFGLYFLGKAQSILGFADFNELLQSLKTRADIVELMYISAKVAAWLNEKPFKITRKEWIESFENDEIGSENIINWEAGFVESINNQFLPKDNSEVEGSKKK